MGRLQDATWQQKARELARTITVAHDLDPEIQEELYGHIEDKLLAYKSGEERVSDEDAFILVREHFGDAKVLASMFAEVHEEAANLSLARRVGAACVVTLAVAWLCKVLALPFQYGAIQLLGNGVRTELDAFLVLALHHAATPILPVAVAVAFDYWRKQVEAGKRPWFLRWSKWAFLQRGVLLMAAFALTPGLALRPDLMVDPEAAWRSAGYFPVVAAWMSQCGLCVAWLWWCGADVRRPRSVVFCLGAWAALQLALNLVPFRFLLSPSGNLQTFVTHGSVLTSLKLLCEPYAWAVQRAYPTTFAEHFSGQVAQALRFGLIALVIDMAIRQFAAKPSPERELTNQFGKVGMGATFLSIFAGTPHVFSEGGLTAALLFWALIGTFLFVSWVPIPCAIAERKLYRVRSLRLASCNLVTMAFFLPIQLTNPRPLTDSLSDTFFLVLVVLSMCTTATMALVNWRKRDEVYHEPDGVVSRS